MKIDHIKTYIMGTFDSVDDIPDYENIEIWLCENSEQIFNFTKEDIEAKDTSEMVEMQAVPEYLISSGYSERVEIFDRAKKVFPSV